MFSKFPHPPASLVVASFALVLAGTSAGVAAGVAINSVGTQQLKANAVTSPKIKNDVVTGADVKEASLRKVPAATNADKVGGTALGGLLQTAGCQRGKVLGLANVLGNGEVGGAYSTAGVKSPYNCAGGAVEVRRLTTGRHLVRFLNNPSAFAFAQVRFDDNGADEAACASVKKVEAGADAGAFQVTTFDCNTDAVVNTDFTLLLP